MCGIFGFVSSKSDEQHAANEEFFSAADTFLNSAARATEKENLPTGTNGADLDAKLEATRVASYRWVQRDGFLAALQSPSLQDQLRDCAERFGRAANDFESLAGGGNLPAGLDWELVNRVVIGCRDIEWQILSDCLGHFDEVRRLVSSGPAATQERLLRHAWQIQLILSGLDRLEVRGRDSAGISIYVHFPTAEALGRFLDSRCDIPAHDDTWRHMLEARTQQTRFTHGAVVQPDSSDRTLLFAFKVAREIGRMGDNVAFLRQAIETDALFQHALAQPDVDIQSLAHTRWASNGVISEPNCHPVDSATLAENGQVRGDGEIVAVLNGDIDNYQELLRAYSSKHGTRLDEHITTDAKIIPVVVKHHYDECRDLAVAVERAFDEFEGSMAIGVMAADRPGEFFFAQKGSGQGLFFGVGDSAIVVASEMYGVVEMAQDYVKAEGEVSPRGEIFKVHAEANARETLALSTSAGFAPLEENRFRRAEITTRDINRGEFTHFLSKEISESVDTVRKTLRGKFEVQGGTARCLVGDDVVPAELLEAMRTGRVRRVVVIGQGTAAVAGQGVAHLLRRALRSSEPGFEICAMKATELSGHHMNDDLSDSLIVAISQSGTTTDTNRTVDMVRERGGWVIAIVNRRNSDLVYKSHGVLYTSDGRDIEMSVASTKAFYAQNVAGQVLALALADRLGALPASDIADEIRSLQNLPEAMQRTLGLSSQIERLAREFAVTRRYWAVVGSGATKIAADEIRIKLSELCYKSIASDFLEDKKHIDLSAEPLVLVCASGIPEATISDVVKEVAIFKAHCSIPIVITDEGETRYDPYAAGCIKVPAERGELSYLLATMVGHLFGFHAARALDAFADVLKRVRAALVDSAVERDPGQESPSQLVRALPPHTTQELLEFDRALRAGEIDSGLNVGVAARLVEAISFLLGRMPLNAFPLTEESAPATVIAHLTEAIAELARPIDAIKHQAKTVTVGISRGEEQIGGVLWDAYHELGLDAAEIAVSHRHFLSAFAPVVHRVAGATLYSVEGLDPLGRPTPDSTVRVLEKKGCAAKILSRCEEPQPLSGTKWGSVQSRKLFLGYGATDSRPIVILPAVQERSGGKIVLLHLELATQSQLSDRLRALQAVDGRWDSLRVAVSERSGVWDPQLLDSVDNETLFFVEPEHVAELMLQHDLRAP